MDCENTAFLSCYYLAHPSTLAALVAFRIQSFAPAAALLQTDLDSQRLADFPHRGGRQPGVIFARSIRGISLIVG